jgi:hypothetical protein
MVLAIDPLEFCSVTRTPLHRAGRTFLGRKSDVVSAALLRNLIANGRSYLVTENERI